MLSADLNTNRLEEIVEITGTKTLILAMGGKSEEITDGDVEEGEISDSGSVEEISEEDFNKQESSAASEVSVLGSASNSNLNLNSINSGNPNQNQNQNPNPRVWTMRDLYSKYPTSRNYAAGLYNLAWAQAVQNKPLDEVLVMEFKNSTSNSLNSGNGSNEISKSKCSSKDGDVDGSNKIVIDVEEDAEMGEVEKEEGELEEGEIDLDLDVDLGLSKNEEQTELTKQVDVIRETLENLTLDTAEKSFDEFCSRLQSSLISLDQIILEDSSPQRVAIAQLAFTAIQKLHSVFNSRNYHQKQQHLEKFLRLLGCIGRGKSSPFSFEQMKEIEGMILSLGSPVLLNKSSGEGEILGVADTPNKNDSDTSANNVDANLTSVKMSMSESTSNELLEPLKSGLPSSKGRAILLPLLDLHKDHDADSLPSPTRETAPCLPVDKGLAFRGGVVGQEFRVPGVTPEIENPLMHPYETDALKAVSTYQQKFGRSSFLMSNRLPSPTPSEDGDNADGDIGGEVSSSSIVQNGNPANASIPAQPVVSSPVVSFLPLAEITGGKSQNNTRVIGPVNYGSNVNTAVRASAKSRDPRLRINNANTGSLDLNQRPLPVVTDDPKVEPFVGITNSRKQKTAEEPGLDGPATKRQRNDLTDSGVVRDVQAVSGTGGWLDDRGTFVLPRTSRSSMVENVASDPSKLQNNVNCAVSSSDPTNVTVGGNEHFPVLDVSTTASLQNLLKDIAVNPDFLMNLIKMEQQKSIDPAKSTAVPPSTNFILGTVPPTSVAPSKPPLLGQGPAGLLQTPTQTASADELGKIRMKPRDPRRILHNNSLQKSTGMEHDQSKMETSSVQGNMSNLSGQKLEDQLDKKTVPPQPDITRQFTRNLKNIANIVSVSQASVSSSVPQVPSSQPIQVHSSRVELKGVLSEPGNPQTGSRVSEEVATGQSRSQNTWSDVEHLFEGFDEQQKAAIQRERARRIEEQKKMFSAHKLCLVLDLDHTLLNSAKFVEVDPVHDEMLRNKEEQDREKPQKHLFRFPHMQMWTKLRPGIWNFLEKASKLYELHLYTMGNKLYATEMAKLLDPKGDLFSGRVISRGDDTDSFEGDERVPKSKDLEGVLGMESAVVIIDDSVRVWPHNKLNLIVVERYIYFPFSRRQFGLPGPSLLEIDHDERPEDGTLASSLAVIEKIHQNFFAQQSLEEADVRNILASEQRKILSGCRIVFSRVFPVGEVNPHLHPLWQTAEQFGAVCTSLIDEQVTHVVANSLGTDKVNWALSTGRFVVHPGWVEASALLYRRANELDFAIKP